MAAGLTPVVAAAGAVAVATMLCILCLCNSAAAAAAAGEAAAAAVAAASPPKATANALATAFLQKLTWFATTASGTMAPVSEIDDFLDGFLSTFVQPTFEPSKELLAAFVEQSPVIANLVRLSQMVENTDEHVIQAGSRVEKVLALYSVDNRVEVDPRAMFEANAELASLWVSKTLGNAFATRLCCSEHSSRRLASLLRPVSQAQDLGRVGAYFGSSYVDSRVDRVYKEAANAQVRTTVERVFVGDREGLRCECNAAPWSSS